MLQKDNGKNSLDYLIEQNLPNIHMFTTYKHNANWSF